MLAVVSLDGNSKEKTATYTFFSGFLSGVVDAVTFLSPSVVILKVLTHGGTQCCHIFVPCKSFKSTREDAI